MADGKHDIDARSITTSAKACSSWKRKGVNHLRQVGRNFRDNWTVCGDKPLVFLSDAQWSCGQLCAGLRLAHRLHCACNSGEQRQFRWIDPNGRGQRRWTGITSHKTFGVSSIGGAQRLLTLDKEPARPDHSEWRQG